MRRSSIVLLAAAVAAAGTLTALASTASADTQRFVSRDPSGSAAAIGDQLVATRSFVLRIGPGDALIRTGVQSGGNGLQFVTYERTYRGLPVIGGDSVVVTNAAGSVVGTANAQDTIITLDTKPVVSADAARATAGGQLKTAQSTTVPKLVVLAWGAPRLAWETIVSGTDKANRPARQTVYVDATTGKVAATRNGALAGTGTGFYNGSVTIGTSGSAGSFLMKDLTRPGLRCGGTNGANFTGTDDVWGNGGGTNLETACVDALYAADKEWDMLGAWLGRNGINGTGGAFPIRVGFNDVNAFWFPGDQFAMFGHTADNLRQATALDVVGHELGHAVFQFTPGGNGADADTENGGLNEGTGDIFGTLTEHFANNPNDPPDFDIGEEVDLVGDGALRRMYNPGSVGDPSCYSPGAMTEVHAAAGPLDHWFYLLSQGTSPASGPTSPVCSGGAITGVGIQTAGQVFYNAMLAKTSTWHYANVRVATLVAAKNLFPGSCTVFDTIKAAWSAVSVGAQAGEPGCTPGESNDFSISLSPSSKSVVVGSSTAVTVNTAVTSGATQTVALSATGLPAGVTATFSPASVTAGGSSTLTLQTTGSTPLGTTSVTVTGTGSVTHSTTLSFTVTAPACASPGQKLGNPGFETAEAPWTASSGVIGSFAGQAAHGGTRFAWLDGYGRSHSDTVTQSVTLPTGCTTYSLTFWLHVDSNETTATQAFDQLRVEVLNPGGTVLSTLGTFSNLDKAAGYSLRTFNVAPFAGQTVQLRFTGTEDASLQTSFVVDDTALTVA